MYRSTIKTIADEHVLVVAPSPVDSAAPVTLLRELGVDAQPGTPDASLGRQVADHTAVLVMDQEALTPEASRALSDALRAQPRWSDIPIIVLAARSTIAASAKSLRDLWPSGNITLLERPFAQETFLSAIRMALRARARQHELRALLAERASANDVLEKTIGAVTADLQNSNQALRLSERLAALGTFAAGLGHDLDNLLLPLRYRIDELLNRSDLPPDAREDVEALAAPAEHLSRLSRGLRHFAKDPDIGWESAPLPWRAWAKETEAIFHMLVPPGVQLTLPSFDHLPVIHVPAHALTQALVNLIANARDAVIARHGRMGTGHIQLSMSALPGDREFSVAVSDNGTGMCEAVRQHCIEPFYTTKVRERGTGLGLAIVHGITQKAGGTLLIDSTVDVGTTITILLPIAAAPPRGDQALPVVARVDISNPQTRAFAEMLLAPRGIDAGSDSPGVAMLWVCDEVHASLPDIEQFLAENPVNRVISLGISGKSRDPRRIELAPDAQFAELHGAIAEFSFAPAE